MLRRPFEFTLAALIGMMNDAAWMALSQRHIESVEHQLGA